MIWRMAWRNLWRHRGRTLIMTTAVGVSYALMLLGMGIGDDSHARMLDEATKAAGGDILVHAAGYWSTRSSDLAIRDAGAVLTAVEGVDGVREAIPRVLVNGLVSSAYGNRPVWLQGVVPAREVLVDEVADDVVSGTFLEDQRPDPIVLGSRLVADLDLELGDRVVLTATDAEGEVTRALFHLTGVLETGSRELDELLGYTTLEAARAALAMEGMLTQVGVLMDAGADVDRLDAAILEAIRDVQPPEDPQSLEVLTWAEAVPEMVGFIELDDAFGYIYLAVIFIVVLFSITNPFLMAVMERVRELGLLSALGLRGHGIAALLLAETLQLTVIAMGAGFLLGYGGHLAVSHWGLSVAVWGVEELEISGVDLADMVIYSRIVPIKWLSASAFVAAATLIAAVYPAWRATRLAPAEAMRFYE